MQIMSLRVGNASVVLHSIVLEYCIIFHFNYQLHCIMSQNDDLLSHSLVLMKFVQSSYSKEFWLFMMIIIVTINS